MKQIYWMLAGMALLTMTGACQSGKKEQTQVQTVSIDTVRAATKELALQYPGKVKAAQDVNLSFRVSGTIDKYYVKAGQQVRAGELLVAMDPTDYEVQLAATEAEYQQIKNDAERVMAMYADSASTASANDKAVYGLKQISAKLQHHRDQLAYTRLTAPFGGHVQSLLFEAHETVGAGMPVLTLIGNGTPEVEINLPAAEYVNRSRFSDYTCTFDVFPGREYALKPISITPMANANQLYTMRLQVVVDKNAPLPSPGMNTMVTVYCHEEGDRQLTVPGSALLRRGEQTEVFIYTPNDKKVHARKVSIVRLLSNGQAIITAPQLQPGEIVVSAGVHHIKDGETVKPLTPVSSTNVGGLL